MLMISTACMAQDFDGFTEVDDSGQKIEAPEVDDYLGFMLLPGSSDLIRFYEIHENQDHTFKYTQLTMDSFVNRAKGLERSNANPMGKNLFESFGIKNPSIVCHLWKLRYKEYPYWSQGKPEPGWANNEKSDIMPSPDQMRILSKYGIRRIQDLCYGEMAFLLLKDMEDSNWLSQYTNIGCGGAVPQTNVPSDEEYLPPIDN